ncbi:MAG TPA: 2-phospho-L-lactate guanylyltransferase [Jatrophihabitans sp.]|jgi:2-phospho-L-lactate guanylyltransferase
MRWTVLVPLRSLPSAKSRLASTVASDLFEDLVTAIRADTLAAVHAAGPVARVVVVGDRPADGVTLVQTRRGLNGALRDGADYARSRWPGEGVAALVGDLPAVRADEIAAALDAASAHPAAFVPDGPGTGTTLLTARPGCELEPLFGEGSAARHATVATRLDAGPGLRHDVDTADDLAAAARVGLGRHTRTVVDRDGALPRSG